ncbi:putative transposon Ty5-1 protein YCL074W [Vitis vinifera]|nr:putative transposon Ty5-1 protein YCL074W [Vitis vinifera]
MDQQCCQESETIVLPEAQSDHTLFYRHNDGKVTILIVYVDDIIVTGNDPMEMEQLKGKLAFEFETKDLRPLRYFLGMEVARNKSGISKEDWRTKMKSTHVDTGRYQRLPRKLIYLSHTRPDIAFAISVVSQYMHAPYKEHMEAVYGILKYLKGSPRR